MTKWIRSLQKDVFNEQVIAFQIRWNLFSFLPHPPYNPQFGPGSYILHFLHYSIFRPTTLLSSPQFAPKDLKELILLNDTHYMQIANISKCQLISKCPFGVFKSPKNQRNFFQDFCHSSPKKRSNQKNSSVRESR